MFKRRIWAAKWYEIALSDRQWLDFGAALKGIHAACVPPALDRLIPPETFSPFWREMVKTFQAQIEENSFDDPTAAKLAAFMRPRQSHNCLVVRADELGLALRARALGHVLCHSDIHAGNLLLGASNTLYIVDWDNPSMAPKERDLMLLGGCPVWSDAPQQALFYQGYGRAQVDAMALTYYRCERIIQDIAVYCQ